MITPLAAAAAIALSAGSAPVADLPRIHDGVESTGAALASTAEKSKPSSQLGLEILGGTIAGGTGSPWMHPQSYDKQSDDRAMSQLKAAERRSRTLEKVLIGVGVFAAASAVAMIATSGGGSGVRTQAQALQESGGGPRGGGAAFVWKVGFR